MTTLNIGGKKVKVDDSFDSLDPAGQQRVIRRIERDLGVTAREAAKAPKDDGTSLKDAARFTLGQGAALGFGDEIEAGLTSAFTDETYDQAVNRIRKEMDDYRANNAGKALSMELAGGLLTAIPTGGAGLAAAAGRTAAQAGARSALGQIAKQGAKQGAILGGIAGFGSGRDTLENRLTNAAIGSGAGATLGAALPAIGNVAKGGINRLRAATDTLSESGVNRAADLKLMQKLEAEGLSPQQVAARLKQAQRDGVTDTMIADVAGESTRGLAQGATAVSGRARTVAEQALDTRQAKAGFDIADDVMNTIASGKTARDALDEISERQMRSAGPAFQQAFKNEGVDRLVKADDIADLVEIKAFRDAIKQGLSVANVAKLNGQISDDALAGLRSLSKAKTSDDLKGLNLTAETMHYVKMGFDDVIGMGRTGQNASSAGRTLQGGLKKAQRQFIDKIDDATGGNYKPALDQFAGNMRLQEAVELGGDLFRMTPDKLRAAVKDMSKSEKEAFRIGVADAIRNRVSNQRDLANSAQDLFGRDRFRSVLREAFPDAKSFAQFQSRMEQRINQEVTRSRTKPSGGSRTTPMAEDARDITRDAELFTNLLSGNIGAVGRDVVTRGGGLGSKIGTRVAGDLFDTNLSSQRELLRRLSQLRKSEQARLLKNRRRSGQIGAGAGAISGLLTD